MGAWPGMEKEEDIFTLFVFIYQTVLTTAFLKEISHFFLQECIKLVNLYNVTRDFNFK